MNRCQVSKQTSEKREISACVLYFSFSRLTFVALLLAGFTHLRQTLN
jgi:hypothetical protein